MKRGLGVFSEIHFFMNSLPAETVADSGWTVEMTNVDLMILTVQKAFH